MVRGLRGTASVFYYIKAAIQVLPNARAHRFGWVPQLSTAVILQAPIVGRLMVYPTAQQPST